MTSPAPSAAVISQGSILLHRLLFGVMLLEAVTAGAMLIAVVVLGLQAFNPLPWILWGCGAAGVLATIYAAYHGLRYTLTHRFQFSARLLLIFTALCALFLGTLAPRLWDAWWDRQLKARGLELEYVPDPVNPNQRHLALAISTDEGLRLLARYPASFQEVEFLTLLAPGVTSATASHVAVLPRLPRLRSAHLDLRGTDLGPNLVSRCDTLEFLGIVLGDYSDTGIESIRRLPRLKGLFLGGDFKITETAWAHFSEMRQLESLVLCHIPMSEDAATHLRSLQRLKRLELWCENGDANRLNDKGLACLSELRSLESLSVNPQRITDEGLTSLSKLENLRELSLEPQNASITNAGLLRLQSLRHLRKLYLSGSLATPARAQLLQAALPDCQVSPPGCPEPQKDVAPTLAPAQPATRAR